MSEPGGTLRGSALDLEPMISYAGNQEDVRLRRIAHLLLSKVYVDVGAGDPVEGSVTYWLYTQGWRGVLVEPGARGAQLAAARPEDVVLTVAVSSGGGDVLLYETAPDPGMSTMRADRLAEVLDLGQTVTQVRVPVVTLTEVFEGAPGPVSVLSLDVEGAEGIVLGSLDWATHRPVVVVVEAVLPWSTVSTAHDFEGHLTGAAYDRVAFDGVNTYYVDSRHELAGELASALDYPTSILDRWRSAAMDRLEHYATSMTDQVAALTTQLDAVTADLASARGRAEAQDREPPGLRGSQREAAQRLGR